MSKYILNPKIKIFLINDNKVEFFIDNGYDNRKIILYDNENSGKIKELIEFITSLREIDSQTLISELTSKYQISSSDLENLIKTLEYNKILLKVDGDEFSTLLKFLDYNNSFNSLRNVNIIFLDHINNYKFIDIKKILSSFNLINLKYIDKLDENSIDKNSVVIIVSHISNKDELLELTHKLIESNNKIVYILNNGKNIFVFDTVPRLSGCIEDFYAQLVINSEEKIDLDNRNMPREFVPFTALNELALSMAIPIGIYDALYLTYTGEGLLTSKVISIDIYLTNIYVSKLLRSPFCKTCGIGFPLIEDIIRRG